jgi:hypothetical protein
MRSLFGGGKPDHPLGDPKEARRLLDELPASDPCKALEDLAHWHESASAAEGFRPEARIQLLFALDDAAQPYLKTLGREYLAAARPSRFQENRTWTHAYEYYRQAGHALAHAIDSVLQGAKGAEAAKPLLPLLVVRALRAIAQQLKWLHLRYGPIDPGLWRLMNGVYAFAEARGIAEAKVAALYPGIQGESTPRQEFMRAVILSLSSPDSLLPPEIELAERLIADAAGSFLLMAEPAPELTHWTDLAQATPPQRLAKASQPAPGLRFFGAGGAARALEGMIRRIEATGQVPASVSAAGDFDTEAATELMRHLVLYWSAVPPERKHPRHSVKSRLSIVHGYDAVLGALNGAPIDADKQVAENWIVENVSAGGFGAVVPQAKGDWLKIGALLAMQPDGGNNWIIGMVRRVSKTSGHEARVGIQTLSRAPLLARFRTRGEEQSGMLLPTPGLGSGEASVALRSGVFVPGQNLEHQRGGRSYIYLPQELAERGEDYDIVRFRELIREA